MEAQEVREHINHSARRGEPFLFGVDYELREGFFVPHPCDTPSEILFKAGEVSNAPARSFSDDHRPHLTITHSDRDAYLRKFDTLHRGLMRGDSFLANLTERTPISTDCSLEEIFYRSTSRYKLLLPGRLVCFSPESFVRIIGGHIHSYPMKGTIDATLPHAEATLMADYKELCEHYTIVDLIRNDLNMIAHDVRVERFRYIDRLKTLRGEILQTSSDVTGTLPEGWQSQLGDLIFRLLPAGSISGAPKPSTLRLIRQAEGCARGYYTGVFGYFDGHDLDSAVMIRYIERDTEGQLFFRSGGGVTIHSRADSEYDEILTKIYLPIPSRS